MPCKLRNFDTFELYNSSRQHFHSIIERAGGNARLSRCLRETLGLKARSTAFRVQQAVLASRTQAGKFLA
jgi:hypothetical protein